MKWMIIMCCRLGLGQHQEHKDPDDEVNDYLGLAIDARSVDRLRSNHVNPFILTFRDHSMEDRVRNIDGVLFANSKNKLQEMIDHWNQWSR